MPQVFVCTHAHKQLLKLSRVRVTLVFVTLATLLACLCAEVNPQFGLFGSSWSRPRTRPRSRVSADKYVQTAAFARAIGWFVCVLVRPLPGQNVL